MEFDISRITEGKHCIYEPERLSVHHGEGDEEAFDLDSETVPKQANQFGWESVNL